MPTVIESIRRFPSLANALDELPAPPANLYNWVQRQELSDDSARVYAAQFLRTLWSMADSPVDITAAWTQWDAAHRTAAVELLNEVCPALRAPLPVEAGDARQAALERLRRAGVDVSRSEWESAPIETLLAHAASHEDVGVRA